MKYALFMLLACTAYATPSSYAGSQEIGSAAVVCSNKGLSLQSNYNIANYNVTLHGTLNIKFQSVATTSYYQWYHAFPGENAEPWVREGTRQLITYAKDAYLTGTPVDFCVWSDGNIAVLQRHTDKT